MYSQGQRRILAGLGLDVWVRRGLTPRETPREAPQEAPRVDSAAAPVEAEETAAPEPLPVTAAPPVEAAPVVRLDLLGLHSGSVLLVGAMPTREDRRLAKDLLTAVAGASATALTQTSFQWPQSSRGDAGVDAARAAFEAFLRGQIERAGVDVVILLGDSLRALLRPETDVNQWWLLPGARCLLAVSAEHLRHSAQHKRNLWHTLLTIPPLG